MAFSWDSVEVRGTDGLLQLGKVIECAEEGLIIDFVSSTVTPQFVPFGKIFRSSCPIILDENLWYVWRPSGKKLFDALMRAGPGEPLKWYKADLLTGDDVIDEQSFGLVTIKLPSRTFKGILSGYRIRERVLDEKETRDLLVKKGSFAKKSTTISIPKWHTAHADIDELHVNGSLQAGRRLMSWFNQNAKRAKATGIASTAHSEHSDSTVTFDILVRGSIRSIPLPILMKNTSDILNTSGSGGSATPAETSRNPQDNEDDGKVRFLPMGILAEAFRCLSTLEQTRMRRVCATWNSILILPEFSRVICVSLEGICDDAAHAACVYNNWKQGSTIVISGSGSSTTSKTCQPSRLRFFFRLLQYMNRSEADLLGSLIVANACLQVEVEEEPDAFQVMIDAFSEQVKLLSGMCRKLILRNVTITLTPKYQFPEDFERNRLTDEEVFLFRDGDVIVHVITGKVHVGGMSASEWWTKFESSLPRLTSTDMQRVDDWVDAIMLWEHVKGRRWEIAMLLNQMRRTYPRDGAAYLDDEEDRENSEDDEEDEEHDKDVKEYQIDAKVDELSLEYLDVSTFSRLTLHSLLNRLDKRPYRLKVELSL